MTLAPPSSILLSILVILPLACAIGLVVWVSWRDRQKLARQKETGLRLVRGLEEANAQISAVVQGERDALASIAVAARTAGPLEVEQVLRAAMKDSSFHDRRALMLHAWEVEKRPEALVALAGMALADLDNTYSSLNLAFATVLREGSAALLEDIAVVLEARRAALDNWLRLSLPFWLERAAARIAPEEPAVTGRLNALAASLVPRWRALLMEDLRFRIGNWEDEDDVTPLNKAAAVAAASLPRFPELAQEVHRALDRHEGEDWVRAHLWFDKAVLHRFYDLPVGLAGFDFDAAIARLCAGLASEDAETSRFAAETAADLLGDYFYDTPDYRGRLAVALDGVAGRHAFTPSHEWLESELLSAEERPEFDGAWHGVAEAVATLDAMTATHEPMVALAELRHLLPGTPAEILRWALVARWREARRPTVLAALIGLAREVSEREEGDARLVQLCLHWPLMEGDAALVRQVIEVLARPGAPKPVRAQLRDLRVAARRLADDEVAGALGTLIANLERRQDDAGSVIDR